MLNKERTIIEMSFKQSFAWRFAMLLSIIVGPLVILANYVIWKGLYAAAHTDVIRGFTFEQMVVYIAISFMISYLTWNNMEVSLRDDVRNGSLATYLLRPISYLHFQFINMIGNRFLAMFLEFLPVLAIVTLLLGPAVITGNWGYFIIGAIIASIINFLIRALMGMLAFYFVRPRGSIEVLKVLMTLLGGMVLPLSLFPAIFQKISLFLPFQFLAYAPTRLYMGNYELAGIILSPWQVLLLGLAQCAVLFIIVRLVWNVSIKKFCGVGT